MGANRGNGIDYIQFGRFDHAGTDYDGPFGNADGISWLDNKNFVFTTAVSTQNIPPIASSTSLCDTVTICVNELVDLDVNFLSPEPDQLTTASYTIVPPLAAVITETNTSPANTANLQLQFVPTVADTGYHTITYTATDDGVPALTSTVSVVFQVFYTPAPPPLITGDTIACAGQGVLLTATGGYENYEWAWHLLCGSQHRCLHLGLQYDHGYRGTVTQPGDPRCPFQLRRRTRYAVHYGNVRWLCMEQWQPRPLHQRRYR